MDYIYSEVLVNWFNLKDIYTHAKLNAITSSDIKSMNAYLSFASLFNMSWQNWGWILYCECSFEAPDTLYLVALPAPLPRGLEILY